MDVKYFDKSKGIISEICANGVTVPFYKDKGPSFYFIDDGKSENIELSEKNGIYTFIEYVLDENANFGDIVSSNNQTIQFTTKDLIGANID